MVLDPASDFAPRTLAPDAGVLFIPSAEKDRVWVEIVNEDGPESGEGSRSIREMDVAGNVTVPDVVLPGGAWPVASVGRSLLFQDLDGGGLSAWDPQSGEFVDRLPGEVPPASHGDLLAWCGGECETVSISNLATGDHFSFTCPGGRGDARSIPVEVGQFYGMAAI